MSKEKEFTEEKMNLTCEMIDDWIYIIDSETGKHLPIIGGVKIEHNPHDENCAVIATASFMLTKGKR